MIKEKKTKFNFVELENLWKQIFDAANDPMYILDKRYNIIACNKKAVETYGYTEADLLKMNIYDVRAPRSRPETEKHLTKTLELRGFVYTAYHMRKDGTEFPVEVSSKSLYAVNDSCIFIHHVRDITYKEQAEESIRRLNKELVLVNRLLRTISLVNQLIVREEDKEKVINGACKILVDDGKFRMSWIGSIDSVTGKIKPITAAGYIENYFESLEIQCNDMSKVPEPACWAARERTYCIYQDINLITDESPWKEEAIKRGYCSCAAFPLFKDGKVIGVMAMYSDEVNEFRPETIKVLFELSSDISYSLQYFVEIEERRRLERALIESERNYRNLVDMTPAGIYKTSLNGNINFVNEAMTKIMEFDTPEELMKKNIITVYKDREKRTQLVELLKKDGIVKNFEVEILTSKGNKRITLVNALLQGNEITGMLVDITERKIAVEKIKTALKEKELLLGELHHRVKNNLQLISSLLKMQSSYIQDEITRDIFLTTQNRIRTMALIHQKLYQSEDFLLIDFEQYVKNLVNDVLDTFILERHRIKTDFKIGRFSVNIETALPCGLIINELLTNSLVHAFREDETGNIEIKFFKVDNKYNLIYKDDGIGIPDNVDINNPTTMGLQLIKTLTKQIDGKVEIIKENGTEFKIVFSELHYNKRI
jgi:PAS domain S-box-containing protein